MSKQKFKVLLIDDTDTYLLVLYHILRDNYEVLYASNGEEGIKAARQHQPDIILLDLVMPGISGFDVLERLKNDGGTKNIPVAAISGKNAPGNEEKARALGAVAYLTKPFGESAVQEVINKAMEKSQ